MAIAQTQTKVTKRIIYRFKKDKPDLIEKKKSFIFYGGKNCSRF
jgi:hypothetical protein